MTLFHPATGQLRVKGVTHTPNTVLHPWLQQELTAIIAALPPLDELPDAAENSPAWVRWQEGLSVRFTLLDALPPLRVLLIMDNIAGHKSASLVCWLMAHGIMPLYTPVSGSWLNMAESIQRILAGRALAGQHPTRTTHPVVGSGRARLECSPNALRLGWQTGAPLPTGARTTLSFGRFRSRDSPTDSTSRDR